MQESFAYSLNRQLFMDLIITLFKDLNELSGFEGGKVSLQTDVPVSVSRIVVRHILSQMKRGYVATPEAAATKISHVVKSYSIVESKSFNL